MRLFLTLAKRGKQSWWRYLLSIFTILFFWLVLGTIPYATIQMTGTTSLEWEFMMTMVGFIFLLLGLFLSIRFIHGRDFITLITAQKKLNWKRYMYGFSITMLLLALYTLIDYLIHPNVYHFALTNWSIHNTLFIFVLGLLFIPLQAAAEELLIRGYLLQELGTRITNPYLLAILTSIPFALLHSANPEVSRGALPMMLIYFFAGFIFALITLKSNSLELAMGIHAANNIFAFLIVNQEGSVIRSPSIFLIDTWEAWPTLFSTIPFLLLLYFCFSRQYQKNSL